MNPARLLPSIVALAAVTLAVEDAGPNLVQDPQDKSVVLEPGSLRIDALIESTARFLGRNHVTTSIREEEVFTVAIELQNRLTLDTKSCESVLTQILDSVGLAYVPLDPELGLWEIVSHSGPRRQIIASRALPLEADQVLARRASRIVAQTAVHLMNLQAQSTTNGLRPFFSSNPGVAVRLDISSVGNSVFLRGHCDELASALEILRAADREAAAAPEPGSTRGQSDQLQALDQRLAAVERRLDRQPRVGPGVEAPAVPGKPEKQGDRR